MIILYELSVIFVAIIVLSILGINFLPVIVPTSAIFAFIALLFCICYVISPKNKREEILSIATIVFNIILIVLIFVFCLMYATL